MSEPSPTLTHLDARGAARMVDVGAKPATVRRAVAEARVRVSTELADLLRANALAKGDALAAARLAGIAAAKRTSELIPLCHQVPLAHVAVDVAVGDDGVVRIVAEATSVPWTTGVEMEALTAATVAALTVYDMGKAVDRAIVIDGVRLLEKTGGTRGDHRADPR